MKEKKEIEDFDKLPEKIQGEWFDKVRPHVGHIKKKEGIKITKGLYTLNGIADQNNNEEKKD